MTKINIGLAKAQDAAESVGGHFVVPQFRDTDSGCTDFNDLASLEGLEAVRRQLENTKSVEPNPEEILTELAALSSVEYDQCREDQAKALNIRVGTLDKEIARLRAESAGDNQQGEAVSLSNPDPWPEPVNGAELLDNIADMFSRYMVLPQGAANIAALWCAHAHAFNVFEHTPRLNITSPQKQCGKTVFLDLLSLVTPKALRTENVTTAVLFRLVHRTAPTLLVDECDSFLKDNEELRGALNAGHRRGGQHLRCEGDKNDVRAFRTFAPVALAGIGALPGTLYDRSIVISLTRAKPGEVCEIFDSRKTTHQDELNRKLARWVHDHRSELVSIDPVMPVYNRKADNWRPLFAIAEVAGGNWIEKVIQPWPRAKVTTATIRPR